VGTRQLLGDLALTPVVSNATYDYAVHYDKVVDACRAALY